MRHLILSFLIALCTIGVVHADVVTKSVDYTVNGATFKGYVAYNTKIKGKRPGILVVHEWWGLNEYARKRARMLADLGYTALALDMYGEGKHVHNPDDAGRLSTQLQQNRDASMARFDAARALLEKQITVDPKRIAAIGYCMGGSVVLEMARAGRELNGVVSFHGGLGTQNQAKHGNVRAKIMVFNGADDPFVSTDQIDNFKKEMQDAGADYKFVNYPGAKHSFTNPEADKFGKEFNLPLAYNAEADKKSWQEMQDFFKSIFK
jgi:dienelactone hydrolase